MKTTERGFRIHEFQDKNGEPCSLQESSAAECYAIWLGTSGRMVQGPPWRPFVPPSGVLVHSRMHLTQDQVRELLPMLLHFAETGELPDGPTPKLGWSVGLGIPAGFLPTPNPSPPGPPRYQHYDDILPWDERGNREWRWGTILAAGTHAETGLIHVWDARVGYVVDGADRCFATRDEADAELRRLYPPRSGACKRPPCPHPAVCAATHCDVDAESELAALSPAVPTGLAVQTVQTSTSTYAWVEPREVASAILRAVHDRMAADEYGELVDPEDEAMLEAVAGVLRRGGR